MALSLSCIGLFETSCAHNNDRVLCYSCTLLLTRKKAPENIDRRVTNVLLGCANDPLGPIHIKFVGVSVLPAEISEGPGALGWVKHVGVRLGIPQIKYQIHMESSKEHTRRAGFVNSSYTKEVCQRHI